MVFCDLKIVAMSDLFNYKFRKDSIMGGLNQSAEKTSVTGDFTRRNLLEETKDAWNQITGAVGDMSEEYWQMKEHGYVNIDDYHHCKANYKATQRGKWGERTAEVLGNEKELFDYYFNRGYKGLSKDAAEADMKHDLDINRIGRNRAKNYNYASPQEACADFREYNKSFSQKYW